MTKYILKRVGYSIVTLFLLVAITFFMMQFLPGDPFTGEKQLPAAQMEALYAKYGLDKPTADLTVEYSDGTATTLHVGSVSPSNERYSYVSLDDEKTVYMVMGTKLSYYTDPVTAYANLTLLTKPSDDDWPN